ALVVLRAVKSALQPRRRDFERVRAVDEVFNVQNRADVLAHLRAVLVCDSARLVNEDADYGRARAPGQLHVDEFEAALAGRAFGYLAHARLDRTPFVQSPRSFQNTLARKRKSGPKTHWQRHSAPSKRRIIRYGRARSNPPKADGEGATGKGKKGIFLHRRFVATQSLLLYPLPSPFTPTWI